MTQEKKTFGPPWTILKMLEWTTQFFQERKIESPRKEAELLLGHCLKLERIMLYAKFDYPLEAAELDRYRALVKRRSQREPMAYIVGSCDFWDITLKTDKRALIPRPDTETLIEAALKIIGQDEHAVIVDVGTGTGAIALTMAKHRPEATIIATDLSQDALDLAGENAQALSLQARVTFCQGDLLNALPDAVEQVDMILSNPPYIGESERADLMVDVRDYEPGMALFAGEDGLDIYAKLIPQAHAKLKPAGALLCEIGYRQGSAVSALFESAGFTQVQILKDLSGHDRVVMGLK